MNLKFFLFSLGLSLISFDPPVFASTSKTECWVEDFDTVLIGFLITGAIESGREVQVTAVVEGGFRREFTGQVQGERGSEVIEISVGSIQPTFGKYVPLHEIIPFIPIRCERW